jgi:hypothetical protein
MSEVLEYYLTGGKIHIGKKEATLELLRKDSVIRQLLGHTSGDLKALISGSTQIDKAGDTVTFDFTGVPERRLSEDPAQLLNELKKRYGGAVGGQLFFRIVYTTFGHVFYSQADLGADEVRLNTCD